MSIYPEPVRHIIRSARSRGHKGEPTGRGTRASFDCGTAVTFALTIDVSAGEVSEVSYHSSGCGYMIAAADVIARLVEKIKLSDLHGLDTAWLEAHMARDIGPLPTERRHCAAVAIDAIQAAFADHRRTRLGEFRGERALICTCFGVSEDTIERLMTEGAATTVADVMHLSRAGNGCGCCRMLIQEMIDERARAGDML